MDTTLRAVELKCNIGGVKRLTDGSVSIYIKSALEFSKAEAWPVSLLQGEAGSVLITPDNIGEDADGVVKPKGKLAGTPSQIQRLLIESIGAANGVSKDNLDAYYQRRMDANRIRLEKELARATNQEF